MARVDGDTEPLPFDAAVFDLDGVLTRTAELHAAAWKEMIDAFLATRAERTGEEQPPFDPEEEYRRTVDGKPRYEGLASFLASRGIALPWGDPSDAPGRETVCGLGNRKQEVFRAMLDEEGVERIEPMIGLARALRRRGLAVGFATASRNGRRVVEAAGIAALADALVDGVTAHELGLAGKPEPDLFLETARRLGAEAGRCVLFEDSRAGVEAGRRGGFGLVVGVAGPGQPREPLRRAGAHLVMDREAPCSPEELEARFAPGREHSLGGRVEDGPSRRSR